VRLLFLGTPQPAALVLERIVRDGRHTIVGVITQPDRPAGRGGQPQAPPVRRMADTLGLGALVAQPATMRDAAMRDWITATHADVGIVAAYGEILQRDVLSLLPHGYLNIHPSLLPRYRGPAPVSAAILAGDAATGVSLIRLTRRMDAGPIIAQATVLLPDDARTGPLTDALFALGADVLLAALDALARGAMTERAQDEAAATYTRLLTRDDGRISWEQPAQQIERMVRAYDPWPGAWCLWRGAPLRILDAAVDPAPTDAPPGCILPDMGIATAAGQLVMRVVQPAGRRAMTAADWWRGQRANADEYLR
jgi:methionyl-tRNA formyltransferase